jgi:cell division protein FtsX
MRFALIWGEAASGLRRNVTMVVSVVLVTFISLTFVGAAILLQMQIGQMKGYWYDKAQVAVYMCTATDTASPNCQNGEAGADQIAAVKKALDAPTLSQYIKKVSFENHQQAYANFEKQFKDNPVADSVTPEYLNQTFWVNLKDPSQSDVIAESLSNTAGVQSVVDQRSYLEPIFNVLNAASYTAIGIAALMLVAAVLLIATTIRLSAISRRRGVQRVHSNTVHPRGGVRRARGFGARGSGGDRDRVLLRPRLPGRPHRLHRLRRLRQPVCGGARAACRRSGPGGDLGECGDQPLPQGLTVTHTGIGILV